MDMQGNAIGSIFYNQGLTNPSIVQAAFTGVNPGRKLSQTPAQTPDPYHLIPKVNILLMLSTCALP